MLNQAPESILMIRPSNFGFNPYTAQSNAFQSADFKHSEEEISLKALKEFDHFNDLLLKSKINSIILDDLTDVILPDAVFPNNWVSFHHDGTVVLYPLFAMNRRQERRKEILLRLHNEYRFHINRIIDYTDQEHNGEFLEGTGSVVFDYSNKIAYACMSPRTHESVLSKMCNDLEFEKFIFNARGPTGQDIYHTNVMMCIGSDFVVICLAAVTDASTRMKLMQSFEKSGHEVIDISFRQLVCFAGNMIEVLNSDKEHTLILSERALKSLKNDQTMRLSRYTDLLPAPLPVIEKYGGGSARCMIAGVFLPRMDA
jgi:hypothetical protein